MTTLVAGFGYVGQELARRLVAAGRGPVLGLRRSGISGGPGIETVAADLLDREALRQALPRDRRFERVVYAASADASTRDAYLRAYRDGLGNLQEVLADRGDPVARLVFVSSTGVYGHGDGRWVDEDTDPAPQGETGPALVEAEAAAHARGTSYPVVVFRLAGIYGPGRTRLIDQVRAGEPPRGNPERWTNRFHRDDCARAIAHLLFDVPRPEPLYLGVDDQPATMREVRRFLAERLGVAAPDEGGSAPPAEDATGRGRTRVPGVGKRCRNDRLRGTGFTPLFPTYRDGYGAMIAELAAADAAPGASS